MKGLKIEWNSWLPYLKNKKIETIYFGGGTPSLMGAHYIEEILSWVKVIPFMASNIEITLEANPEDVTSELMESYAKAGINRVSMGIQTLDPELLKLLGRLHSAQKAIEAVEITRNAGITNISVDLMYDLPGQTIEHWKNTLAAVQKLPITHLSLYNLTIEPHTQFFKNREEITKQLPDEEVSLEMYQTAVKMLGEVGLNQYEISAFAKDDYYSKHNVGYWVGREFLGLGPSAFSFMKGKRFRNIANLNRYVEFLDKNESPVDFEEQLSVEDSRKELLAVQLRLMEGVDLKVFQSRYGELGPETFKAFLSLSENELISYKNDAVKLSSKGILFYDTVAVELI